MIIFAIVFMWDAGKGSVSWKSKGKKKKLLWILLLFYLSFFNLPLMKYTNFWTWVWIFPYPCLFSPSTASLICDFTANSARITFRTCFKRVLFYLFIMFFFYYFSILYYLYIFIILFIFLLLFIYFIMVSVS